MTNKKETARIITRIFAEMLESKHYQFTKTRAVKMLFRDVEIGSRSGDKTQWFCVNLPLPDLSTAHDVWRAITWASTYEQEAYVANMALRAVLGRNFRAADFSATIDGRVSTEGACKVRFYLNYDEGLKEEE